MKKYSVIILALLSLLTFSCKNYSVELKTVQVEALKQIQFYEYKVSNLKVDTLKVNTILDDKLVGFYSGHVNFGIDFDYYFRNYIDNDSVVYIDTKLVILNKDNWFITSVDYMETGSFTNSERKALDIKANRAIYEKCMSEKSDIEARKNLEAQITDILTKKFHFKKVVINCKDATEL